MLVQDFSAHDGCTPLYEPAFGKESHGDLLYDMAALRSRQKVVQPQAVNGGRDASCDHFNLRIKQLLPTGRCYEYNHGRNLARS
jgi:hypothetical protein